MAHTIAYSNYQAWLDSLHVCLVLGSTPLVQALQMCLAGVKQREPSVYLPQLAGYPLSDATQEAVVLGN